MPVPPAQQDSVSSLADEGEIVRAAAAALRDRRPIKDARLKEAAHALQNGQPVEAEQLLSTWIERRPDDPQALHLLGETALKLGQKERAEMLLARCVTAAPDYDAGRFSYASTLYQRNRLDASLAELKRLLAADPHNILYLDLKGAVLTAMGRYQDSMLCRRQLADEHPGSWELQVKYGKALRSIGERDAAIGAFRRAIALNPSCGSAWWSLADLKTWRFSEAEIAAMEWVLAKADKTDRMYLHFALGKASADSAMQVLNNYARQRWRLTIPIPPGSRSCVAKLGRCARAGASEAGRSSAATPGNPSLSSACGARVPLVGKSSAAIPPSGDRQAPRRR
jgi:predicted Zn-dependent protease